MAQNRVRIADVADSLGLSTATVSKLIYLGVDGAPIYTDHLKRRNVSSRSLNAQGISQIWQAFCLREIIQESSVWW